MANNGSKGMKAIGYVRVSTSEQAAGGFSLEAQEAKLRAWAMAMGLDLVEIIVDAGQSAKTLDRPGLQRALAILREGQADGLLIAKLDRLTRSVADLATLLDGYFSEKAGRQLWSVADSIDTRTAAGRMVLNILMSVAQWEREAIGERVRDTLAHKRSQGHQVGKIRYGLRKGRVIRLDTPTRAGKTRVQLVVDDPAELEALDRLRQWKKDAPGLSLAQLARKLDRTGTPTKSGKPWSRSTVYDLLKRLQVPTTRERMPNGQVQA